MEKTLIIVPSGQAIKKDSNEDGTVISAQDAFVGTPFKLAKKFAETFGDYWVILNPVLGFIRPEDEIDLDALNEYGVNAKKTKSGNSNNFVVSLNTLRNQAVDNGFYMYDKVLGLGGKAYREYIEKTNRFFPSPSALMRGFRSRYQE